MKSLHSSTFLLALVAAAALASASRPCVAEEPAIALVMDVGRVNDFVFGDFAIDGAIQDVGSAFGQYFQMEDGSRELRLTLYGQDGDLEIVINDVWSWSAGWFDVRLASNGFTLAGGPGGYGGLLGEGSASGYVSYTDSWWSWGYPSIRENWFLSGELTLP